MRRAQSELRNFEADLPKQMPQLHAMKDFRKLARNVIEHEVGLKRPLLARERTDEEEERLDNAIRQLQKEKPHMDLTTLLESRHTEGIRKKQHLKSYQTYKAYKFLKANLP